MRHTGAVYLCVTIVLALSAGVSAQCPTTDPCNCLGACYGTYEHTSASGVKFYYGCGSNGLVQAYTPQTCAGSGQGDPHFVGYDGQTFDFMGQADEHWAIFSEPMLQLNALFVKDPVHDGTNMGAIGLKHGGHHVTVRLLWTEDGKHGAGIEVIADNNHVGPDETVELSFGLKIERLPAPSMGGYHQVWIRTGQYDFLIQCPPEHSSLMNMTSDSPQWAPHLDIVQAIIKQAPLYELHGVLGQTYNSFRSKSMGITNISASSQENTDAPQHPYEGGAEDYRVSDLFATDFKFNKYTGVAAGGMLSRARRMLTASRPLTASVMA